jgi:hypothetical protein
MPCPQAIGPRQVKVNGIIPEVALSVRYGMSSRSEPFPAPASSNSLT